MKYELTQFLQFFPWFLPVYYYPGKIVIAVAKTQPCIELI